MTPTTPRDPQGTRGVVVPGTGAAQAGAEAPRWGRRIALTLLAAVVLAGVLRALTGPVFLVPSASMEPTLLPGDRVHVDASAARGEGLRAGDVVVFDGAGSLAPYRRAGAWDAALAEAASTWGIGARPDVYVKRVLALPGDTLACCSPDGRLTRNDVPLDEPYLGRAVTGREPAADHPWRFEVPAGRMVVLGDNRADSRDSRALLGAPGGGLIPLEKVVGRADAIVWPLDRRGGLPGSAGPDAQGSDVPDPDPQDGGR